MRNRFAPGKPVVFAESNLVEIAVPLANRSDDDAALSRIAKAG
jgi:hypothetical protein